MVNHTEQRSVQEYKIIMSICKKKNNKQKGAAAFLTIVIIGAASLLMAIGSARLGLGELESGLIEIRGASSLTLADGCIELALGNLRKNVSYTGETLSVGGGSCIISVSGGGSTRTIISTATIGTYIRKIQVQISIVGSVVTITSWSEIST